MGEPTVSLAALLTDSATAVRGETTVTLADYAREILASGFPGLRGLGDRALRAQLDGYVSRVVDREFPQLGVTVRNPSALRRWLTAYVGHLRTAAGEHEFDLIVERDDARVVAIEVKLAATVDDDDVRRLIWLKEPRFSARSASSSPSLLDAPHRAIRRVAAPARSCFAASYSSETASSPPRTTRPAPDRGSRSRR